MAEPLTRLDHHRLLGNSGLRVSPLCLGTMTFGTDWGWGADESASRAIFDRYVEAGGNFIATATLYAATTSGTYVGRFIKADRDRFVLATKYSNNPFTSAIGGSTPGARPDPNAGGNGRKNLIRSLDDSLKRLQTDYIDLYWLHIWDFSTPVDEVMRALDDVVRQGKVTYIAVSDTPAWKVSQLNQYAADFGLTRFIAYQAEYSLVTRDVERDVLPMCRELGLGLLPWSPLAGGILSGKYSRDDLNKQKQAGGKQGGDGASGRGIELTERKIGIAEAVKRVAAEVGRTPSQVALNWLLTRPGVTSIILGARKVEQLDDNLGCLEFTLSGDQLRALDAASTIDLGFPHTFINSEMIQGVMHGGAKTHIPKPYLP